MLMILNSEARDRETLEYMVVMGLVLVFLISGVLVVAVSLITPVNLIFL